MQSVRLDFQCRYFDSLDLSSVSDVTIFRYNNRGVIKMILIMVEFTKIEKRLKKKCLFLIFMYEVNFKVYLLNGWNSKQMITEGKVAVPLETTLHAFRNHEKTKQRSTIVKTKIF